RPWSRRCAPAASRAGLASRLAEPVPDVLGAGVVQVLEDVQGLPPGLAGRLGLARGQVGVAEPGQREGLVVPVGGPWPQLERDQVALDRAAVVAQVLVH